MRLLQLIVQRQVLIILLTIFTIILGVYTLLHLEKELTPTVGLDSATIQVEASNLHVDDIERKITIPLEQKLQEHEGIREISSTTSLGHSSFVITFENGKGDEIFKDVESKTSTLLANMSEIDHIQVSQNGVNTPFEFIIDVSDGNLNKMTAFAKNILQPRLEELPEVREVMFIGLREQRVDLHFNEAKMKDHHLIAQEVVGYIQQINSEGFLGELTDEKASPSLHWDTTFENIDELESLQIPTENGFIKLSEIATISINPVASSSNTWKNGTKDVIMVQIARKSDVAQAAMTEAVRNELQNIEKEGFVKGFTVNEVIAHADFVQDSMEDVTKNIVIGGVIALVVLLLFLRNVRATIIIGLSIPTSILLTIIMMGLLDYSMNLLTLIGLGLGIGMMVDASIVILESIYRKKEQGLNNLEAVLEGTKEVATAIIASVLTTIVVFLPIGFIGGDSGKFMLVLSVVVAVTLISSVLIAFTLIPTFAKRFMKLKKQKNKRKKAIFLSIYENIVSWCIKKKSRSILVIVTFLLVFSLSFLLIPKIQMNMMPDIFNRYTEIVIDLENGVSPNEKESIVEKVNDKLSSMEDVTSHYLLDFDDRMIANIVMTTGNEVTKEQDIVTNDIVKTLRELEKTEPIRTVERALDGVSGYPVQLNISGDDFSKLQKMTNELQEEIEEVDGIVRITNTWNDLSETEAIQLEKEKIKEAELSELQIKQHIEQFLLQEAVGTVEWEGEELRLYVHQDNDKRTKDALLKMKIPTKKKTVKKIYPLLSHLSRRKCLSKYLVKMEKDMFLSWQMWKKKILE